MTEDNFGENENEDYEDEGGYEDEDQDPTPDEDSSAEGLVGGKFKSVEALEEAYRNAESELTRTKQSRSSLEHSLGSLYNPGESDLLREQEQMFADSDEDDVSLDDGDISPEDAAVALQQLVGDQVEQRVRDEVQRATMPLRVKDEIRQMKEKYDDFEELIPDIQNLLEVRPDFQNIENPLEIAYQLVSKHTTRQQATKEAYNKIGKKRTKFLGAGSRHGQTGARPEITREWVKSLSQEDYAKNRDRILAADKKGKIT